MAMTLAILIGDKDTEGSIKNWVNRSDIPAQTIVDEAMAWVIEEGGLRVREMIAETDPFTIDADTNEEPLPADFLDPIMFQPYKLGGGHLEYKIPEALYVSLAEDGTVNPGDPSRWAIIGTAFKTDMAPEENYSGILTYYARPAALVTTNFITVRWPSMFRHACLARAYSHMKQYQNFKDEERMAKALIEEINQREDLYLRGAQYV
jgi:hypothetical protein